MDEMSKSNTSKNETITKLYRENARRIVGYLRKNRVPHEHAEELMQEAFVTIARSWDTFRGESPIEAWIRAIVHNALTDYWRKQGREVPTLDSDLIILADDRERRERKGDSPPEGTSELERCMRTAFVQFQAVNVGCADVLIQVTYKNLSIGEVATMIKRTEGATREFISQCKKKFREFAKPCREFLKT